MALSYFGSPLTQADVAATLRPNGDDKNTSPEEMVAYAQSQGYRALMRPNGDAGLLRLLLSNGLPVIIETWHEPEPGNGMGHYRLLVGYDDASATWLVYDSYDTVGLVSAEPYGGIRLPYDETMSLWEAFGRVYVVIYDEGRAPLAESILGEHMVEATTWQRAAERASADTEAAPEDAFAWFNLGTALTALGRYDEAAAAFDRAREIGLPMRMFWYQFAAFRAYHEVGRYQDAVSLADATLAQTDQIEELWYWKGLALEAMGQVEAGRGALETAARLNPNNAEIARALGAGGG
jgi:tetratricopeptide (TPR) repeat protein